MLSSQGMAFEPSMAASSRPAYATSAQESRDQQLSRINTRCSKLNAALKEIQLHNPRDYESQRKALMAELNQLKEEYQQILEQPVLNPMPASQPHLYHHGESRQDSASVNPSWPSMPWMTLAPQPHFFS